MKIALAAILPIIFVGITSYLFAIININFDLGIPNILIGPVVSGVYLGYFYNKNYLSKKLYED